MKLTWIFEITNVCWRARAKILEEEPIIDSFFDSGNVEFYVVVVVAGGEGVTG